MFVGPNGQGKTNLVESVLYLASLGSHRVSNDAPLVKAGKSSARVGVRVRYLEREFGLELTINKTGANQAKVNRTSVRPRELPRYLAAVAFAPEDLGLVKGDPGGRRRFIDELLLQHSPRMAGVMADYERILKQRTALLKTARHAGGESALSTLELWNEKLVTTGSQIILERVALVSKLRGPLQDAYKQLVGADHSPRILQSLSILESTVTDHESPKQLPVDVTLGELQELFQSRLDAVFSVERDRGVTLVGPHRDDLVFELNHLPAKGYASHGESWSFALSLKLASATLLREYSAAGDPVLILDDVFAELDENRRSRLARSIADYEQVLITSAIGSDIPDQLNAHRVQVRAGTAIPEVPDE